VVGCKLKTHAVKLEHTIVVMGAARHTKKGETRRRRKKKQRALHAIQVLGFITDQNL
jgi:hypothetical protein